MRRILLFVVIIAVSYTTTGAKAPRKTIISVNGKKMEMSEHRINRLNSGKAYNRDPKIIRHSQKLQPIIAGSKFPIAASSFIKNIHNQSPNTVTSVPVKLLGSFSCKGVSYFGGYVTGETVITADNTNPNKIWFSNLVPGASTKEVYGIVSADQKTVSIPQGQQIYTEGLSKANLTIYNSSDDVTGQFNESTGVLTISSDLWGSKANDGWVELFSGIVTYTRTDMLPPVASYRQPQGGLFLGLDPDGWGSYSTTCIVNSPFVTWNWKNNNIEEDVSYLWSYTDSLSGENFTSGQDSLLMDVEDRYYSTPKLTATNKKNFSGSLILGADYKNKEYISYTLAGGNGSFLGFDEKCDYGGANLDNGFTLFTYDKDSYFFGTGASLFTDANYESLLVYYEEPLSTLYFEGVNVYLFVFDAPENTPFTMNVVLADKSNDGFSAKGKVVAKSTILAKDVLPLMDNNNEVVGYTMKFNQFVTTDNDGFEIVKESFEMEQAFYLELTGFNVPGVSLAACTEEINPLDGESRSGFMFSGNDTIYSWNGYRQTMYFNLAGMAYSYISTDEKYIYDNRSGGTYNIDCSPYFDTLYFGEQYLPEWVHAEIINQEYSDDKWGATLSVTIDPLAANAEPRYSLIVLKTAGATKEIPVNQGGNVSNGVIKNAQASFAYKNQQGFMIKYSGEMNSLTVYNWLGKIVGRYNLPETGNFQLDGSELVNGLYLLKLNGEKGSEIIKVVK